MIRGRIGPGPEPLVEIDIVAPNGSIQPLEFILDTGYTGSLTLPPDIIERLGLTSEATSPAILADGQDVDLNTYTARAMWHGQQVLVEILETAGHSLLGMSMLWGSKLTLEAQDGGEVTIEEMRPTTE